MSNGIGKNPLNDISKVYVQQVVEKKKDDTYLEPDMKKRQANNEKARKELAKGPQMKNPHFESVEKSGWDAIKACTDGYEAVYNEAVKGQDSEMRKAASAERKSGDKRLSPSAGKGYADQQKQSISYMDKKTKNNKIVVGMTHEALDPVGKEDGDVNNDGKKDSSDKYLMKRRKAIATAMASTKKKMSEGVRDLDPEKGTEERKARLEKKRGMKMDDHPQYKKSVKETYSSWRNDLSEVMTDDDISDKPIKEKKVTNTIKINPKLGEAIEAMGGELIEATEVDEAVYGGTPAKKEAPKDTRMVVTNADKKANTPAYQKMKAGDKRYKAADHMGEDVEVEGYEPMTPERKLRVDRAKRGAFDKDQRAQYQGDKKEADKQFKRRMAMDSRTKMRKEEASMSDNEIRLQKQKARIDQMIAQRRKQDLAQAKKSESPAKAVGEGLSVDDQMRISKEYNRKSPEEKKALNKKAVACIPKTPPKKDTRTDAQKMTDATGPRPGSRYRGD